MANEAEQELRAYVEYLRDLGVRDFYRLGEPVYDVVAKADVIAKAVPVAEAVANAPVIDAAGIERHVEAAASMPVRPVANASPLPSPGRSVPPARPGFLEPPELKLVSFNDLAPLPAERVAAADRPAALRAIQEEIGDCTRCPLAYAG